MIVGELGWENLRVELDISQLFAKNLDPIIE
jgi:hypothetical protein